MANTSLKTNNRKRINNGLHEIPGIAEVEKELYSAVSDSHGQTYEICTNLIKSGGKRIRPLLVLSSSLLYGPLNSAAVNTAVACELIHMASLVHDDIIDNATIRRNRPSVNIQIGKQSSVLVGDYLFAKAFEVLSKNRLIDCMLLVVEAIGEMCDGEIVQANNRFNFNQSIEDYYSRIYKKTGILISACCQAGAVVGGATPAEIKSLGIYGTNIGYAFQITDDILDFVGDKKNLGKAVASDLREGNITIPILKLIEHGEYRDWLENICRDKEITEQSFKEILRVLQDSYALQESYMEAKKCINEAKNSLNDMVDSRFKQNLLALADNLLLRKV